MSQQNFKFFGSRDQYGIKLVINKRLWKFKANTFYINKQDDEEEKTKKPEFTQ